MLLGNYNIFNRNQVRNLGGVTDPTTWFKPATLRNFYASEDADNFDQIQRSSFGTGFVPPYAWVLSPKWTSLGGRSSGSGGATANLAMGINLEGQSYGLGTLAGALSLITALAGTATGVGAATGVLIGLANLVGTSAGVGGASADLDAKANLSGTATGVGGATGTFTGIAHLSGEATPFTDLSPQALAAAVWQAVAASYNDVGTMGEKLNAAGGGSNPADIADAVWDELLAGHTTSGSASQIVKAIKALVAAGL